MCRRHRRRRPGSWLSSVAQFDLINLPKLSKKLATYLILCLLGLAISSNRSFLLRQIPHPLTQNASFHLPVDDTKQFPAGKRALLIAVADETVSDLFQVSQDSVAIETDLRSALSASRLPAKFQTPLSSRPPVYILQSALNL
jgi:hypothetical protein